MTEPALAKKIVQQKAEMNKLETKRQGCLL